MKKTVTSMLHVGLKGGVYGPGQGAWLRTGPRVAARVENMAPAEAPPVDDTEALNKPKKP